jgi:hypothetical protein
MKKYFCFFSLALVLLGLTVTSSNADIIKFTATGDRAGLYAGTTFGYVEYDYATFLTQVTAATTYNAEGVKNSYIIGLSFTDPQSPFTSFATTEVATQQYGAVFMRDSGGTPILTEGQGWLVQNMENGWTISGINTNGFQLSYRWDGKPGWDPKDHTYSVVWHTNIITSPVPLPPSVLLLAPGLLGLAAMRRSFKK